MMQNGQRSSAEFAEEVKVYLDDTFMTPLKLDDLAKHFFVSKYYICRSFKTAFAVTPHSYVNRRRILSAKMMIDGGSTALAAAYRVGFEDYSAFYRAYVHVIGVPPTGNSRKGTDHGEQ